jgi:hypothetical protein
LDPQLNVTLIAGIKLLGFANIVQLSFLLLSVVLPPATIVSAPSLNFTFNLILSFAATILDGYQVNRRFHWDSHVKSPASYYHGHSFFHFLLSLGFPFRMEFWSRIALFLSISILVGFAHFLYLLVGELHSRLLVISARSH